MKLLFLLLLNLIFFAANRRNPSPNPPTMENKNLHIFELHKQEQTAREEDGEREISVL